MVYDFPDVSIMRSKYICVLHIICIIYVYIAYEIYCIYIILYYRYVYIYHIYTFSEERGTVKQVTFLRLCSSSHVATDETEVAPGISVSQDVV